MSLKPDGFARVWAWACERRNIDRDASRFKFALGAVDCVKRPGLRCFLYAR